MPKGVSSKIRTATCKHCGKAFETKCGNARYCPECRPIIHLQKVRAQNTKRKAKRGTLESPVCGVNLENHRGISADCRAARAMGLTYGMWRARYG